MVRGPDNFLVVCFEEGRVVIVSWLIDCMRYFLPVGCLLRTPIKKLERDTTTSTTAMAFTTSVTCLSTAEQLLLFRCGCRFFAVVVRVPVFVSSARRASSSPLRTRTD